VIVSADVYCCGVCGWRWGLVIPGADPPKRCANPTCRSRLWAKVGENIPHSLNLNEVAEQLIRRAAVRRARAEERERATLLRR
jgi:hypothetical protein